MNRPWTLLALCLACVALSVSQAAAQDMPPPGTVLYEFPPRDVPAVPDVSLPLNASTNVTRASIIDQLVNINRVQQGTVTIPGDSGVAAPSSPLIGVTPPALGAPIPPAAVAPPVPQGPAFPAGPAVSSDVAVGLNAAASAGASLGVGANVGVNAGINAGTGVNVGASVGVNGAASVGR